MPEFSKRFEFGNYTLNFGDQKVLLDLLEEIVAPSFHEMKHIRTIKNRGQYFFIDTKVVRLGEEKEGPILGIAGRIVKNTKLKRDQIFRNGIVEDKSELETAPSSTFLLILNNHRLIFCREVPGAPTLQNFQSTSHFCLRQEHKAYIERQFNENEAARDENPELKKISKRALLEKTPYPTLRITPLSDSQGLRDFVNRFSQIDKLSIKLLPTNKEEIDNDEFWADFGRRRESMNSNAARVEFSNPQEGLDRRSVYTQAQAASNLGNSEVDFKGHDVHGDTIKGNNEDFSLSIEVEDIPKNPEKAAIIKYKEFQRLVKEGIIALPKLHKETWAKIKALTKRL
ncbi:hypothetical protein [Pseudomonas sp. AA-38]|uniref:hypothetical protein n=1 Tax=Pseudomonas sp. AA-38 TaxID=3028807 RepID=UPI0023F8E36A|nr:hypothetical protein [Pseudomonas sp. AA-38]